MYIINSVVKPIDTLPCLYTQTTYGTSTLQAQVIEGVVEIFPYLVILDKVHPYQVIFINLYLLFICT